MWLSFLNWIDAEGARLSAAYESLPDLGVANLAQRRGSRVWRTPVLSQVMSQTFFVCDFGANREIGALALMVPRTNDPDVYSEPPMLAPGDTIRHRLDLSSPGAGALLDTGHAASGVLPGYGVHVFKLSAPVTARYWRCDIDAISRGPLGYIDVARAWAGPVMSPRVGISYGATRTWQSDSIIARASRGTDEFIDAQESLRAWSFTLDYIDDATEANAWEDFERRMTSAGQFLVCRTDLPTGRGAMFARQSQSAGLDAVNFGKSRKSFRLIESI